MPSSAGSPESKSMAAGVSRVFHTSKNSGPCSPPMRRTLGAGPSSWMIARPSGSWPVTMRRTGASFISFSSVRSLTSDQLRIARQQQEAGATEHQADGADRQRRRVAANRVVHGAHPQRPEPGGEYKRAVQPSVGLAELRESEVPRHQEAHEIELGAEGQTHGDGSEHRGGCSIEQERGDAGRCNQTDRNGDEGCEHAVKQQSDDQTAADDGQTYSARDLPHLDATESIVPQHRHEMR